ncbi:HAMP domain-containing histidine kinase [bacterium]|nr:HAMP domain-containing histidine kinase [bacterium]
MSYLLQHLVVDIQLCLRESHGDWLQRWYGSMPAKGGSLEPLLSTLFGSDLTSIVAAVVGSGKTLYRDQLLDRPGLETCWVHLELAPAVRRHKVVGMTVTLHDVSVEKEQTRQADLIGRIEQLDVLTRRFISRLGQPLLDLSSRLGQLAQDTNSSDMGQELRSLHDRAQRLAKLTQDLDGLIIDRRLHNRMVDVPLVLEKAADLTAMLFARQGVRFESLPAVSGLRIRGHEATLEQCFSHVLRNAAESMPRGGLVRISAERSLSGRSVQVTVSDQGCGMSDKEKEQACEPFFTTKQGDHSGLGLTISYAIAQAHGGTIGFDSNQGKGTTVTLCFPVEQGHLSKRGSAWKS